MTMVPAKIRGLLAATSLFSLAACAGPGPEIQELKDQIRTPAAPIERTVGLSETSRQGADEVQAVLTFEIDPVRILSVDEIGSDPLPKVAVGPLGGPMPLSLALELIAWETDIIVDIDPAIATRDVSLITADKVPADRAIDMITRNAGVFYLYQDGVLRVTENQLYLIEIPGEEESFNSVLSVIEAMNVDVRMEDEGSNTLLVAVTPNEVKRLHNYLSVTGTRRDLIIVDTWVYEVFLDGSKATGINWREMNLEKIFGKSIDLNTSGALDAMGGGYSLGVLSSAGNMTLDALVEFLNTQGGVRSVANPTLTMVSGRSANFRVGEKQVYVSKIETTRTTSSVDREDAKDIETDELETGINLDITAMHSLGVVFAELELEITDLISFHEFDTGDGQIALPSTSERELSTGVQARPGDVIVIGGLLQDRSESNATMLPVNDISMHRGNVTSKSELVIMMRPRVVRFQPLQEGTAAVSDPVSLDVE